MSEMVVRFILGGFVVSLFAMFSDALRPKSYAGLFSAAPSIALATLGLTIHKNGYAYAAWEARSMVVGAFAFLSYAAAISCILRRYEISARTAALATLPLWFITSFCLWHLIGRT